MSPHSRTQSGSPYDPPRPGSRRLRIFSLDPSLAQRLETTGIREAVVTVPWEAHPDRKGQDGPAPGPKGEYLEVIDYDPASGGYYRPVDLNDPYLLAQDGLPPSDGNPQFHQQMVYAVAMRTIQNFEVALGRRAMWSVRKEKKKDIFVRQLRIYPHALREPNAFYSPDKKALLFGYFPARPASAGELMPGGLIFTCLSHDVVAHETAHALLDGMHHRLIEPSNPDVLAFHEAFADIVALFQHFSLPGVVEHVMARTRGNLDTENLLAGLAQEFGRAIGRSGALRSAIGTQPDPTLLDKTGEPHQRGAILMAAIFDAFLEIYRNNTADLFRLATGGSGVLPLGAIHPDLAARLAREAAKAAQRVLTICIRALDYLPPVDLTLGEYLRALITADFDLYPDDISGYRVAFTEAFRRRGIFPREARSLSEESLRWNGPGLELTEKYRKLHLGRDLAKRMRGWNLSGDREVIFQRLREARAKAHAILDSAAKDNLKISDALDLARLPFEVHALRPVRRTGRGAQLLLDGVMEVTQRRPGYVDQPFEKLAWRPEKDERPDFWFRGGCTLIFDLQTGQVRYCIYKRINSKDRYERQREYVGGRWAAPSLKAAYFDTSGYQERKEVFRFVHMNPEPEVP